MVGTAGTTYDITVTSISGSGTLRLDVNSAGTGIIDAVGNAFNGGYTSGPAYIIDQTPPVIISINRYNPPDENTTATTVTFRVIFSEAVTGVDINDFFLSNTGTASGI